MKKGTLSFRIKLYLVIVVGIVIVGLLYKFNTYTQYYFLENNKIQKQFNEIRNNELQLRYNVLMTSLYMYTNNDSIIHSCESLDKSIKKLLNNKYFKDHYPKIYLKFITYKNIIKKKINYVYEFETLNSPIKNSIMYLSYLLDELPKMSMERMKFAKNSNYKNVNNYAQKIIDVISSIFLARSSLDNDFIKNLNIEIFLKHSPKDKVLKEFNNVFVANLKIFKKYFPEYINVLKKINNNEAERVLLSLQQKHLQMVNKKIIIIKIVSYSLMAFVLMSVLTVVLLLLKLQKDYLKLEQLNKELHYSYMTDKLTQLFNRNKFDEDIVKFKNPVLIIVNIDRFKNINDYYGSKTGDEVLIKTAKIIKNIFPKGLKANFYRLGADDFGILFEKKENLNLHKLSIWIINNFEKKEIDIHGIKLHLSVSIGISLIPPYIENADIALKRVKKSSRLKFLIFDEDMNAKKEIKVNVEKTNVLYRAIKENRIEPYFQPIVETESSKVYKYEVLARVIHPNGTIESIFPYLQIAKDSKLYADITKTILQKTYVKVKDRDVSFSLNISIEDIYDNDIVDLIYKLYLSNEHLSKKTTFEILESEAVNDYDEIENFIKKIKGYNATIAIDDFGSGYSNFEHLVNLQVDFIKIDGSLIKNIHKNQNAYKIVKVISDFAKELNIKTVAEYVANEEIYEKVREISVDYSQGFYFYKPQPYI